jgi:hypothetical protein
MHITCSQQKKNILESQRQGSVFAIGGGQVFNSFKLQQVIPGAAGCGGPPGSAIGAATATAATTNPSPGSCGDAPPALLPGTPPVSKPPRTHISISTMFDGQVVSAATRFYSSISSLYCVYI